MNLSLISKILRKYPILVVSAIIIPLSLVLLTMRAPKAQFYQEDLNRLEMKWHEIQTNMERSDSLSEDIEAMNTGLEQIEQRLMDVEAVASNYEFFYRLERESGINLERFILGMAYDGTGLSLGKENLENFAVVPCEISMSGTIQQILRFVDLLDRQDFIIRMDLMNVQKTGSLEDGSVDDKLTAQMRCYALASKDE